MKRRSVALLAFASLSVSVVAVGLAFGAQDRFTLKSPNGISFATFKGYEKWQMIASSQADDHTGCGASPDPGCIKSILGNPALVKAYAAGIPENGKPFPDGAMFAKIEWSKARNDAAPYGVTVPGKLAEVAFMMKDAKRFASTNGWGYATFKYDDATSTWRTHGENADFALACDSCHTKVKARDFVYTSYGKR
jgi:hypothetical protein